MKSKKTLAILITTLLMLSIALTLIPVSATLSIGLDSYSDPVGTPVIVSGDTDTPGGLIKVYWDSIKDWDGTAGYLAEDYATGYTYTIEITIPETVEGDHEVIVKDIEAITFLSATFTVTSEITLTPKFGLPDDLITVTGTGFATESAIIIYFGSNDIPAELVVTGTDDDDTGDYNLASKPIVPESETVYYGETTKTKDTDYNINYVTGVLTLLTDPILNEVVTIDYTYYIEDVTPVAGVTTSELGSFDAVIEVPVVDLSPTPYNVLAVDAAGNSDLADFTVNEYIIVTPDEGPIGFEVIVSGRVTPEKTIDILFGSTGEPNWAFYMVVTEDILTDSDGYFSTSFVVPSVSDGDYLVGAFLDGNIPPDSEAETPFTVNPSPNIISINPDLGLVGLEGVEIIGEYFTSEAKITVYFGTINVTSFSTVDGSFTELFDVPDVALGEYTVKVIDEYGLYDTITFTVTSPPVIVIETRATEYMQGDWISIYGECTVEQVASLVITDPDGIVLAIRAITVEDWDEADGGYVLPYYVDGGLILPLPADAPLGSWNFTAYDVDSEILDTNLFTVAAPTLQAILDRLGEFEVTITGLITVAEDNILAVISTTKGELLVSLDAINATIVSIDGDVATIDTALGTVTADISTLLDYFPVEATVSMTPVWVAVVCSLIAALAAIYAAFQISSVFFDFILCIFLFSFILLC